MASALLPVPYTEPPFVDPMVTVGSDSRASDGGNAGPTSTQVTAGPAPRTPPPAPPANTQEVQRPVSLPSRPSAPESSVQGPSVPGPPAPSSSTEEGPAPAASVQPAPSVPLTVTASAPAASAIPSFSQVLSTILSPALTASQTTEIAQIPQSGVGIILPNGGRLFLGSVTTINGIPISLSPSNSVLVIDGSTTILPTSGFIALSDGQSLAPVLVPQSPSSVPGISGVNSPTTSAARGEDVGSFIYSGIGGFPTSSQPAQFTGGCTEEFRRVGLIAWMAAVVGGGLGYGVL
ncbi:hypothetical protein BCR34DRAFT_582959 [Clohesyomyces aquaticus]|uniref:Uncharacterized protein n=1 Tax=Clohesyomyces aquaticus TaxID=1231657 RepID=A0A1Y2A757_9PLEO|nr:hypothetical protein BCR34DRAFT_582959 [Clohesyomyces aquaticus]